MKRTLVKTGFDCTVFSLPLPRRDSTHIDIRLQFGAASVFTETHLGYIPRFFEVTTSWGYILTIYMKLGYIPRFMRGYILGRFQSHNYSQEVTSSEATVLHFEIYVFIWGSGPRLFYLVQVYILGRLQSHNLIDKGMRSYSFAFAAKKSWASGRYSLALKYTFLPRGYSPVCFIWYCCLEKWPTSGLHIQNSILDLSIWG